MIRQRLIKKPRMIHGPRILKIGRIEAERPPTLARISNEFM